MKTKILLFFSLVLIFSCSKEQVVNSHKIVDNELLSEWMLIETYMDPGDGSGDFTPYEGTEKILQFVDDSTLASNLSLCQLFNSENLGSYSSLFDSTRIYPQSCNLAFDNYIYYEMNDSLLYLNYLCIEACVEKYVLID